VTSGIIDVAINICDEFSLEEAYVILFPFSFVY
jgi:hypothetical protein